MTHTRREAILGGAALAAAGGGARAAPAFRRGALVSNVVAQRFETLPASVRPPRTRVLDGAAAERFNALRGKVRIVSLWAEWCAPCLFEAPDLAALNARHQPRGFEVVAVLTGSGRKLSWTDARALLDARGARLPLWVEPDGGSTWMDALAQSPAGPTLPCNLIVDRAGRLRGRAFGASPATPLTLDARGGRLTALGRSQVLATNAHSIWATAAADAFVEGLLAWL